MITYDLPSPPQFGQNGTFSGFRIPDQNVPAFEVLLSAQGRDKAARELFASKLCGPWSNGNPIALKLAPPGTVFAR